MSKNYVKKLHNTKKRNTWKNNLQFSPKTLNEGPVHFQW